MRLIVTLIFGFYSLLVIRQPSKVFFEYPEEFKKVKRFNLLSSSDTFDCFGRVLILSNDSIFRSIHFNHPLIFKDSGSYSLLSQNVLLFRTATEHGHNGHFGFSRADNFGISS